MENDFSESTALVLGKDLFRFFENLYNVASNFLPSYQ